MPKITPILNSFSSGEISPLLEGRVDIEQYFRSVKTMENFVPMPWGGATRRPGTYYVAEVKDSDEEARLIPFQFNVEQAYMLEFGDRYIRFFMDEGQIVETAKAISGATQANPVVVTCTSHGYSTGDQIYISRVVGMTEINGLRFTITVVDANSFSLDGVDGTGYSAYVGGDYGDDVTYGQVYSADSESAGGSPSYAFDNAEATNWVSNTTYPHWVKVDFGVGNKKTITKLYIKQDATHPTTDYKLQGSLDDITWTDLKTVATGTSDWQTFTFTNTTGYRYYRLYAAGNGETTLYWAIDEVEMMEGGAISEKIYEIASPYLEDELFDLQFAQDADMMWIVHPNHKPRELSRTAHTTWTLVVYDPTADPFAVAKDISGATEADPVVVTATAHGYSDDDIVIINEVVGMTEINGRKFVVTNKDANTFELYDEDGNSVDGTGYTTYVSGGICEQVGDGPSCVTIYEQRLVFANVPNINPQEIWASKSGDYDDMTTNSNADDALVYILGTEQVDFIRWLSSGEVLAIGTMGGVMILSSGDETLPLTPTNVNVRKADALGCLPVVPKRINSFAFFIQRDGKNLNQLAYKYENAGYIAIPMTLLAEHILGSDSVVDMDYQQSPYNMLWIVRGDGVLATMTRLIEQKVTAWARHTTIEGNFESVAVIPQENADDQVWVIVNREEAGLGRFIEFFKPFVFDDLEDAYFVDCGLTYDGLPTTTITGLKHLTGEEVAIVCDGVVQTAQTVPSTGELTVTEALKIHVGLEYTSTLKTLRIEAGSDLGTTIGKIQRINRAVIKLYKSLECKAGIEGKQDEIDFNDELFTGSKELPFPAGYGKEIEILITQEEPLPLTILAIVSFMQTFEG